MSQRIQIIVESKQYELLRQVAKSRRLSLSAVLRDIIDQWAQERSKSREPATAGDDPIWQLAGLIPPAGGVPADVSEKVGHYLYPFAR